jgi:hypothetical protein
LNEQCEWQKAADFIKAMMYGPPDGSFDNIASHQVSGNHTEGISSSACSAR